MAEEKESTSVPLSQDDPEDPAKAPLTSSNSSSREVRVFVFVFSSYLFRCFIDLFCALIE